MKWRELHHHVFSLYRTSNKFTEQMQGIWDEVGDALTAAKEKRALAWSDAQAAYKARKIGESGFLLRLKKASDRYERSRDGFYARRDAQIRAIEEEFESARKTIWRTIDAEMKGD